MAPSDKPIPAATAEDQEGVVARTLGEPIRLGTPAFSSPDPNTERGRMLPLIDDVSAGRVAAEAENADAPEVVDYAKMSYADLKRLADERDLEVENTGGGNSPLLADYAKALSVDDAADFKAADFKRLVEGTTDQAGLDAVALQYESSGREYKSVIAAIEKRQTEINDAAQNPPQS